MSTFRKHKAKGCISEVDLEYPEYMYNFHNDYPLALVKIEIKESMLSDYCKTNTNKHISIDKIRKVVSNFGNENKFVLHYQNLQLYLQL